MTDDTEQVVDVPGWKLCRGDVLVELAVPAGVELSVADDWSSGIGRKCRARLVRVIAVHGAEFGISIYDKSTIYRTDAIVECDRWEPDPRVECGGGIHFYLARGSEDAFGAWMRRSMAKARERAFMMGTLKTPAAPAGQDAGAGGRSARLGDERPPRKPSLVSAWRGGGQDTRWY